MKSIAKQTAIALSFGALSAVLLLGLVIQWFESAIKRIGQ
jgi:hypothetical protein